MFVGNCEAHPYSKDMLLVCQEFLSKVHSTAVIWSQAQLHWLEVFQTSCKGVNQCLIPTSQPVYCLCMFPDFAFCLECYVLVFLCCFLHFLSQACLILSVTFKAGLIFMGATTDKVC